MKELGYFVYQVYPKSYLDTTGNGIGDINGVRRKLKYIADLGFDYIWLTPIFLSPQKDNGYDVADYLQIDPLFGTMADFEKLIAEANDLGLKIMLDMVFNHTSTAHSWFQKALANDEKYLDYYIWRNQPTNWPSKFGGNSWEYAPSVGKYYLHLFDKSQADLNWENPAVREELYAVVNYWIAKGIKGFRFDVINLISKRYPLVDGVGECREQYTDGPRVHEFIRELRANTFSDDTTILTVGEMNGTSLNSCLNFANENRDQLDSVFHFHHLKVDYENGLKWSRDFFDFKQLQNLLKQWQLSMQEVNAVDTLFWSCHDQPRIASRLVPAENFEEQLRKNKMLAMLMYLMRGISYIYQGEEIGMENLTFSRFEELVDIEAINYYLESSEDSVSKLQSISQKSRDNGRSPMQWTAAGDFTSSTPWVKYNTNMDIVNVESQLNDSNSTLAFYKQLISLKKTDKVVSDGIIRFIDDDNLIIYTRELNGVKYKVICNLWATPFTYIDTVNQVLLNNDCEINGSDIHLNPFASIMYKLKS